LLVNNKIVIFICGMRRTESWHDAAESEILQSRFRLFNSEIKRTAETTEEMQREQPTKGTEF